MPLPTPDYGGHLYISELIEEIDANLGKRVATDDPGHIRIKRHIDLAQQRLAKEDDWKELYREASIMTTFTGNVNNDAFVDLYSKVLTAHSLDLRDLHSIRIVENEATDHKLIQVMPRQWDLMFPDSRSGYAVASQTSDITHYILWQHWTAQLFKVPNAAVALTLRFTIWPTPIYAAAEGSTTSVFENKDDILIALATHNLFQSLGMRDDAKQYWAIYQDLLEKAKKQNSKVSDASRVPYRIVEQAGGPVGEYWLNPFIKESV